MLVYQTQRVFNYKQEKRHENTKFTGANFCISRMNIEKIYSETSGEQLEKTRPYPFTLTD